MAKLRPQDDPSLFEYEPEDPDDAEVYESMALRGVKPEVLVDKKDRARYVKYLKERPAS